MIWIYIALIYTISVVVFPPLATGYLKGAEKQIEDRFPFINLEAAIKIMALVPLFNTGFTIIIILAIPIEAFHKWNFNRKSNRIIKNVNKIFKKHNLEIEIPPIEKLIEEREKYEKYRDKEDDSSDRT